MQIDRLDLLRPLGEREGEDEGATVARRTLGPDLTAVQLHEFLANGQAEPGAAWAVPIAIEHDVQLVLRESPAVVVDHDPRSLAVRPLQPLRPDYHVPILARVIHRVGDQILQDLPQLDLIPD